MARHSEPVLKAFSHFYKTSAPALKATHSQAIAIGCSGGKDSVVAAHAACITLKKHYELALFHVNHGQQTVAQDMVECVLNLGQQLALPTLIEPLKLAKGASEATLRQARLQAFETLWMRWREGEQPQIITAHHAQDQLETILFRLMRGADPSNLPLIKPRVTIGSIQLWHPLLDLWPQQISDYARRHKLKWVEDPSNSDTKFARNAVRHELIPLLERLRPRSSEKIVKFFSELSTMQNNAPSHSVALTAAENLAQTSPGLAVSDLTYETLKRAIEERLGAASGRVTRGHWESLKKIFSSSTTDGQKKTVEFPAGTAVIIHRRRVMLKVRRPAQ